VSALEKRIQEFLVESQLSEESPGQAAGLLAFVAKDPRRATSDEDIKSVAKFLAGKNESTIAAFLALFRQRMLGK
jgi:hypothetical protein